MTPLGTVPIYFETNDRRVLAYLRKNVTHHDLIQRQGVAPLPQPQETAGGKGYIRHALYGILAAPFIYAFIWWFLAIGSALTMEIPQ